MVEAAMEANMGGVDMEAAAMEVAAATAEVAVGE